MATITGIIEETGQNVTITIPTVKVPETPELGDPIEDSDSIIVYDSSENKTSHRSLSGIRSFLALGGGSSGDPVPPTIQGSAVEIVVDSTNISTGTDDKLNRVLSVALQNKTFRLTRVGYGPLLTSQFNILPSGGFEIVDDTVRIGDVFIAETFSPVSATPGTGTTASGALITGISIITDDTPLTTAHVGKSLHVSATKNVTITLFDIADAPANLVIPIETTISNGYMTKVQTKVGQLIYFGGDAVDHIWMGSNEFLWLLRGADGWYIMKASDGILNVGKPSMDYAQRLNTVIAQGQTANRDEYPRLWEWLSSNTSLIVADSTWGSITGTVGNGDSISNVYAYHGKFSYGDGSSTFRFPDHRDFGYVALLNIGGSDPDRVPNTPGGAQWDMTRSHHHTVKPPNSQGDAGEGSTVSGSETPQVLNVYNTENYGGSKTVGKNIGLLPLINI